MSDRRVKVAAALPLAVVSAIVALYCEIFRESLASGGTVEGVYLFDRVLTVPPAAHLALFFAVAFALLLALARFGKPVGSLCFKWRYPIAGVVLLALVALEVNGSSIGVWSQYLSGQQPADAEGLLFGLPRPIRSDEWLVFTPLSLSQDLNGYAPLSDFPRGVETDLRMVYAQPSWALATLFRPFFWGYLLLGSARGLSFFWCGRLVALFMVSFEFGRLVTRDNRLVSFAYALAVAFAPVIQWWFSVNGVAELFVFGQGLVLVFRALLGEARFGRRVCLSALFAWLGGCFVLILYPAWQVPVGYVVGALLVAEAVEHRMARVGDGPVPPRRRWGFVSAWAPFALCCAAAVALLAVVLVQSIDVVQTVRGTEYPGGRFETGGEGASLLFNYVGSWTGAASSDLLEPNVCEVSNGFVGLFPLGIVLAVAVLVRERDPLLIGLLAVDVLLLGYSCLGFPDWLAKVTLLGNSTSSRSLIGATFIDLLLIVRCTAFAPRTGEGAVGRWRVPPAPGFALLAALVFAGVLTLAFYLLFRDQVRMVLVAAVFAFIAVFSHAALRAVASRAESWRLPVAMVVIAVAGFCVNPVQQGVAVVTESDFAGSVGAVVERDASSRWIADDNVLSQACVACAAPTVSSVAIYPDLEMWAKLDEAGEYTRVYNRYAHFSVMPTREETSFELLHDDAVMLHVNPDDLAKIGVGYWVSNLDLQEYGTDSTVFAPVSQAGSATIYRVSPA